MRDELYINGVKVDLGKTNISLKYTSNLLSDISKIMSNNSYTIKLPKTAKNLALIECVHIPSAVSKFPYLKHAGTLIRDGIEIVKNANVVLLEINESIEIALSWGNVINFANVANGGKKLTDLSHGTTENADWVVWKNWEKTSELFPGINYGLNNGEPNAWNHPVMKVTDVINKIQSDNEVTFDIPNDKLEVMNKMIVPLLTKNDSKELVNKYPIEFSGNEIYIEPPFFEGQTFSNCGLRLKFNGDESLSKYGVILNYKYNELNADGYKLLHDSENTILTGNININFQMKFPSSIDSNGVYMELMLDDKSIEGSAPTSFQAISPFNYYASFKIDNTIDLKENQVIWIKFYFNSTLENGSTDVNLKMYIQNRGEVLFGEKFPFVPNLPDIKQIEFIKAITSILGLFAIPGESNTIKFIPFDNLKDNLSKAVDWTSKVVKAYRESVPRSMKYALDNTAQNNRFLYKEDDSVKGNYDGNLKIEDSTLDFERDAIKLPFSACDTNAGVASISMYSYNDNGELQYKKVNPRLLLLEGINGVFKGLEWETLLSNNYSTYKGMVNEAKVLTEYIRLNSIELRDLEMDVPVYLGQYGCYLAIIEINTKENDICECKLLKLEA